CSARSECLVRVPQSECHGRVRLRREFHGRRAGGRLSSRAAINLRDKFDSIGEQWQPRVVAEMNDYQFKLAKIQGEFIWHAHADTDEVFIIVDGEMTLEFRDGKVDLKAGDMYVVPRGVEHKPVAANECAIMLVEPRGTRNTGDAGGERTAPNDVWI